MILRPDMSTATAAPWTGDWTLQVIHDAYDRDGDPIPTLRLEMAATFDFEDAVALDPDAPKVSELTLRWILWVGADGPVAFTGRLTGARGPIRVNILEVRARRPS